LRATLGAIDYDYQLRVARRVVYRLSQETSVANTLADV
jgi:hypothetical protein